ncbi:hypothetical protein [Actinoplanes sp. NPDC051494]|uniref:hypothetical protein n=1 Tax=Actinoplanes sp. NPDC051494 TaxID=3363907 RepID=UPI0037A3B465
MRVRRPAIAALALVAALGLAGCGPEESASSSGAGTSATGEKVAEQASAETELASAVKKLNENTMKVDMRMAGALSMSGVADGRTGNSEMSVDMGSAGSGSTMSMRKIDDDIYLKIGGDLGKTLGASSGGKEWMHLDAAKLGAGSSLNFGSKDDPAGAKVLLDAVTGVERVGDHDFKGTLDLTKSPRYNQDKESLAALGDKATNLPFTAKTDTEGRLTELAMDMSGLGAGAGEMTTKYSDFGTEVSVEAPPSSQVQEMPSSLSGILNA